MLDASPSPARVTIRRSPMAERLQFDGSSSTPGRGSCRPTARSSTSSPKAFDLLEILVQKRPEAVPRAEIEKRIWRSTHVSDTSLAGLVGELRKALGDQGQPAALRADRAQLRLRVLRRRRRGGRRPARRRSTDGLPPDPRPARDRAVARGEPARPRGGRGGVAGLGVGLAAPRAHRHHRRDGATLEDLGQPQRDARERPGGDGPDRRSPTETRSGWARCG